MSKIVLDNIASGYNLNKINDNFDTIAAALNDGVLYRDNPEGETNSLQSDIDCNSKNLYNIGEIRVLGTVTLNGVNLDEVNSALIWRGEWDSITAYAISDAVTHEGSSFIAIQAHTNSTPDVNGSAYWEVLSLKGADGSPGDGTGDVVGPASSADNKIVLFDGTSGKSIKDSGYSVSDLGGAKGGGSDKIFWENEQTITEDYTLTAGYNAGTFGPVSVDTGVVVTVPTGAVWSVV